jgi:hypothetical protein
LLYRFEHTLLTWCVAHKVNLFHLLASYLLLVNDLIMIIRSECFSAVLSGYKKVCQLICIHTHIYIVFKGKKLRLSHLKMVEDASHTGCFAYSFSSTCVPVHIDMLPLCKFTEHWFCICVCFKNGFVLGTHVCKWKIWYIIRTFVIVTVYLQHNNKKEINY